MSASFPDAGKVPAEFLEAFVYPRCGAARPEVRVGPQSGVDAAVIDLPNGLAMALTTDPCSLIPPLGFAESAWLTVHLLASDITTTGCAPMYALFDLNLPPTLSTADFDAYWGHIDRFCADIGCAIVGGHTGRFEGQHATVVGGGMMVTVAPQQDILTSRGGRPGDRLIVAGQCGIAAAAILARSFPKTIAADCGTEALHGGRDLFYETSTARAAQTAVRAGRGEAGVTAMHDATEGGIRAALVELAAASGCGLTVDKGALPASPAIRAIAARFGLDPLEIVSSGALLIAAAPDREQAVLETLHAQNIAAVAVGSLTAPEEGMHWFDEGRGEAMTHTGADPYWQAFHRAFEQGLT